MPIVVSNQPAQMIGDLAQNAGNFATQQAQSQAALENARLADSMRHGDEQLQIQRDQMAQQAEIAKQHIQAQVMAHVLSSMSQQQLEKLREDARMKQIAAQGGNQQTIASINGSNRAEVAGMRDTTQRRGQDLRTGVAYDRMGQQSDQYDQTQQQKADQFGVTSAQRDQGLGIRQQQADSQQAFQQGRLALGDSRNTLATQQQERLKLEQEINTIRDESRLLQHVVNADPRNHLPETATARSRLNELGKRFLEISTKLKNDRLAATQPVVQATSQFQPPPMGMYAGDATPGQGGNLAIPAPQQTSPDMTAYIQQLVQQGLSNEQIKAILRGQ